MAKDENGKTHARLDTAWVKEHGRTWFEKHNAIACIAIGILACAALAGIFAFVAFSDFGGSADFIYNQF